MRDAKVGAPFPQTVLSKFLWTVRGKVKDFPWVFCFLKNNQFEIILPKDIFRGGRLCFPSGFALLTPFLCTSQQGLLQPSCCPSTARYRLSFNWNVPLVTTVLQFFLLQPLSLGATPLISFPMSFLWLLVFTYTWDNTVVGFLSWHNVFKVHPSCLKW